jgi:hypothetical protein
MVPSTTLQPLPRPWSFSTVWLRLFSCCCPCSWLRVASLLAFFLPVGFSTSSQADITFDWMGEEVTLTPVYSPPPFVVFDDLGACYFADTMAISTDSYCAVLLLINGATLPTWTQNAGTLLSGFQALQYLYPTVADQMDATYSCAECLDGESQRPMWLGAFAVSDDETLRGTAQQFDCFAFSSPSQSFELNTIFGTTCPSGSDADFSGDPYGPQESFG